MSRILHVKRLTRTSGLHHFPRNQLQIGCRNRTMKSGYRPEGRTRKAVRVRLIGLANPVSVSPLSIYTRDSEHDIRPHHHHEHLNDPPSTRSPTIGRNGHGQTGTPFLSSSWCRPSRPSSRWLLGRRSLKNICNVFSGASRNSGSSLRRGMSKHHYVWHNGAFVIRGLLADDVEAEDERGRRRCHETPSMVFFVQGKKWRWFWSILLRKVNPFSLFGGSIEPIASSGGKRHNDVAIIARSSSLRISSVH
ncbi:hypothetical protein B0H17DRAFT_491340 [Mycena rosella]|uniref:Uncharacterized protein n=1 Tax=Mycena rosella TaxID=1033263 RepID=A0AAD7DNB8_MYCRO|nr:hypothetical protein B0H17DRAFT_491340 [Mycena rosella]